MVGIRTARGSGPRVSACNGRVLNTKLLGRLTAPDLEEITILVYRYHDFDFRRGRFSPQSRTGLINSLCRAAERGVNITFVTRDPFTESPMSHDQAFAWYKGLQTLAACEGAEVLIHNSLHAKVYLVKSIDDRVFYAVGSSNLTFQGMGGRWAECNVVGYSSLEYAEVEKEVMRIINGRDTSDLDDWARKARKHLAGFHFFTHAR